MNLEKKILEDTENNNDKYVFESLFRISPEELDEKEEEIFTFSKFLRKNVEQ